MGAEGDEAVADPGLTVEDYTAPFDGHHLGAHFDDLAHVGGGEVMHEDPHTQVADPLDRRGHHRPRGPFEPEGELGAGEHGHLRVGMAHGGRRVGVGDREAQLATES